jgi:hypothetical protein
MTTFLTSCAVPDSLSLQYTDPLWSLGLVQRSHASLLPVVSVALALSALALIAALVPHQVVAIMAIFFTFAATIFGIAGIAIIKEVVDANSYSSGLGWTQKGRTFGMVVAATVFAALAFVACCFAKRQDSRVQAQTAVPVIVVDGNSLMQEKSRQSV